MVQWYIMCYGEKLWYRYYHTLVCKNVIIGFGYLVFENLKNPGISEGFSGVLCGIV